MTSRFCFAVTALLSFTVFTWTSAPGLGLVDSGELTTAVWSLGVAHPTGYPLYVMAGHIWQALLPLPVDRSMVLFSALALSLACGVFSLVSLRELESNIKLPPALAMILAISLSSAFAFSSSALGAVAFAEVYPLTVLIAAILLWLASQAAKDGRTASKHAVLAAYLWGLGFGNHLTILWFIPVVLYMAVRLRPAIPHFFQLAASVVLGASLNLFLPIRSSVEPLMNWGEPDSLARLIRHLSAWQYRVWMFREHFGEFVSKLLGYLGSIPADIGWGLSILVLVGIIAAVWRRSWLAASLLAAWVFGTVYNMNYSIPDISTYFLTFYVPLFVIAVGGFVFLAQLFFRTSIRASTKNFTIAVLALVVPASGMVALPADSVQNHNRFARDFATELLHTLPDSALVIQADWDIQSPCIYLQNVEGLRRDVVMLDLNLMQRSWYVHEQALQHPDVFAGSEREVKVFLNAVAAFEAGKPFQSQQIEAAFVALNNSLIAREMAVRPVYLRDAAATGHPGVGSNFLHKAGAFFFRISSKLPNDAVLNPMTFLRKHQVYSEREQKLITEAAQAIIQQGRDALVARNASYVRNAAKALRESFPHESGADTFLSDADRFLGNAENFQP